MSSYFTHWPEFGPSTALHLVVILIFALILSRFARSITNRLVRPAGSQVRAAQLREEQTRAASNTLYRAITRIIWTVALLASLPVLGVNIFPLLILATLAIVIAAFAAQNLLRDLIAGFTIIFEDQFTAGELIEVNGAAGRVEQITLRRTVIRDARGALVTIANAKIRTVSNLSRDWSQSFLDVSFAPEAPLDTILQALETAAASIRNDAAWSQILVDGPRILGVQTFDRDSATIRLQLRTVPMRQDEVARELRRRVHAEFQSQGIYDLAPVEKDNAAKPVLAGSQQHQA